MDESNIILTDIENKKRALINGGFLRPSLFERIKGSITNAVATATIIGALLGVAVPKTSHAQTRQQHEMAMVEFAKKSVDKVSEDVAIAESAIRSGDYHKAEETIKILEAFANKIKNEDLKKIVNELRRALSRKQHPVKVVHTTTQHIHNAKGVNYQITLMKTDIKFDERNRDPYKLTLYKNELRKIAGNSNLTIYENKGIGGMLELSTSVPVGSQ